MKSNTVVYLMQCDEFYKIGVTDDLGTRLARINTSIPFDVRLIKSWGLRSMDECHKAEVKLHTLFKSRRLTGKREWFRLSESDIKSLYRIMRTSGYYGEYIDNSPVWKEETKHIVESCKKELLESIE